MFFLWIAMYVAHLSGSYHVPYRPIGPVSVGIHSLAVQQRLPRY
jgi:hypothetical protein